MMKKSSFGNRVKKRLSDITNMNSHPKSPLNDKENVLPLIHDSSTKKYVQQLVKENAMMMKLIQEKDKIIESNGLELQKVRVNLQRTQLQNWHLAQSNTQMLTELNMCKDKLKTPQHDNACKDAFYKAKMIALQEEATLQCQVNSIPDEDTKTEKLAKDQPKKQASDNENNISKTKRGRPTGSQSLGETSSQQVDKEMTENKRRCLRRQSVRLKPQDTQADLFEIDVNSLLTQSCEQPLPASNSETQMYREWREEKPIMQCEENSMLKEERKPEKAATDQPKQGNDKIENEVSKTTIGSTTRSRSLGAASSEQAVGGEIAENKRLCLRRQSVRLKPKETQTDLFDIVVNTPLTDSEQLLHASNSGGPECCEWRVETENSQWEETCMLGGDNKPEKRAGHHPKQANDKNKNYVSKTKIGRSTRSQSLGATNPKQVADKEIGEADRRLLERQSVPLDPQKTQADLFESVITPLSDLLGKPLLAPNSESGDDRESTTLSSSQRSSLGRPSRRAAGKIQSYKDPPLNTKMRRP